LFIGAFVLSHSTSYLIGNQGQTDKKEQTNDKDDQQQIKLPDAVLSLPTQNTLNHQFFLLEELSVGRNNEDEDFLFKNPAPPGRALRVLFRQIMSSNAP